MGALPAAWLWLLLSLLPLEVLSRGVNLPDLHDSQRPSVTRTSKYPKSSPDTIVMPTVSIPSINHHIKQRRFLWRALMRKETGPTFPALLLDPSSHLLQKTAVPLRRSRGRRHASVGRGHGHLMRAGCILGTCQVQNLSHRLYQLIGQSGRENSSPMNPYSPHSYG